MCQIFKALSLDCGYISLPLSLYARTRLPSDTVRHVQLATTLDHDHRACDIDLLYKVECHTTFGTHDYVYVETCKAMACLLKFYCRKDFESEAVVQLLAVALLYCIVFTTISVSIAHT